MASPASPMTMSAAWTTAWRPELQNRLTVTPATVTGRPARSAATRATLWPAVPWGWPQPRMISSTFLGSRPGTLAIAWRIAWAARSSGRVALNEPRTLLASGVRELATMTASLMAMTSLGGIVEPAAFGGKPGEQVGRLPVVAEAPAIVQHPGEHDQRAEGVGVEHRAAAMAGKPEAVAVDDVDVAGAVREVLLEDPRALVGQRR